MIDPVLLEIRARLAAAASPAVRASVQRFSKEPIEAWGVLTPQVRVIAREVCREVRTWPLRERNRLCAALWNGGTIEEASLAIEIRRRDLRRCTPSDFRLFERWVDRYVANWGACDGVSVYLLAPAIERLPELAAALPAWTNSENRWKRRAAAVALVREARRGRLPDVIFEVAGRLASDPDEMVQKGVGWLLKETYPLWPREVVRFLNGRPDVPRLVLRYAAEKMTAEDRAAVLDRVSGGKLPA